MRHKKAPPYNKQFLLFKLSTTRGAYQFDTSGRVFIVHQTGRLTRWWKSDYVDTIRLGMAVYYDRSKL